ncbi:haloacid dehalogenase [Stemphylium lycopersici]|uniref:Haloacid dehalogenase n=1 Tax=Stemphylium lycopersici TaxID=183478 RepID=A0A364N2B1_STELY|nr:haloacid dehalogenase [Stemphylium lycopersici]
MEPSSKRINQADVNSPRPLWKPVPELRTGMALSPIPRALLFDVFGTCVDWPSRVRLRASEMTEEHWGQFAQEWRNSYKNFTKKVAVDPAAVWMSIDDHHRKSLKELIAKWKLEGLWDEAEVRALSLVWHHLVPWEDSVPGVQLLNQLFATCTLSNGNMSLLSDLRAYSGIPFTHVFSAEMFGTYKPSPKVYLGAVEELGVTPGECVMVAAHLGDLKAAKANGLHTVYVERAGEEDWGHDEIAKARAAGWVDMWVDLQGGNKGFLTVAEKLGVGVERAGN